MPDSPRLYKIVPDSPNLYPRAPIVRLVLVVFTCTGDDGGKTKSTPRLTDLDCKTGQGFDKIK